MHGGYDVSVVGEIVTAAVKAGDLLIEISGSGETEQLIAFAKRATSFTAKIVLLTVKPESTLSDFPDEVFRIGVPEIYAKVKEMRTRHANLE